jgi:hypothetical protein
VARSVGRIPGRVSTDSLQSAGAMNRWAHQRGDRAIHGAFEATRSATGNRVFPITGLSFRIRRCGDHRGQPVSAFVPMTRSARRLNHRAHDRSMLPSAATQITRQLAKRPFNMMFSNFMAALLRRQVGDLDEH